MQIRSEVKPALWGAAGGAVVLALIGFTWGGWVTGANARDASEQNAGTAVVSVLAPICVTQFRSAPDAAAKLAELEKVSSYQQAKFVEDGGWATMPGAEKPVQGVGRACAVILTTKA